MYHNKSHILGQEEIAIPQILSQLSIHSLADLNEILKIANQIKHNLPYSIKIKINKIEIFDIDFIDSNIEALERELCLTVNPREIMQRAYNDFSICNCKQRYCAWCINRLNQVPLVLIDFRTENEQQAGTIPNSMVSSVPLFPNSDNFQEIVDQYSKMKDTFHFCILTSNETLSNTNFDDGEITENTSNINSLERILAAFEYNGFAHISVAEGGFEKCHEFAMHYKLHLDNHQEQYCLVCTPDGPNIASLMKSKLKKFRESMIGKMRRTFSLDTNIEKIALEASLIAEKTILRVDPASSFYNCKKYDKNTKTLYEESYFFYLQTKNLMIGQYGNPAIGSNAKVIEEFKIIDLLKITSVSNSQKILTFYFSGSKQVNCYVIKPSSATRTFIDQIKKQFSLLKKLKV